MSLRKLSLLCAAVLCVCSGCNRFGVIKPTAGQSIGPAVRDYLASDEEEVDGYGFYSYLLFPSPPKPATLERYRAALDAFLRISPRAQQLGQSQTLNLTYLLVTEAPPPVVTTVTLGSLPDSQERKQAIAWLIDHYDYPRAKAILDRLGGASHAGPYILQAPTPLAGEGNKEAQVLRQDLAALSPEIVSQLVDHVLIASENKQTWHSDLQVWYMHVRDIWADLGINTKRTMELISLVPIDKLLAAATH